MLNNITLEQALEDFLAFWKTHFPEQEALTRETALASLDEQRRGFANLSASDQEMIPYQDDVSRVYGAYEKALFQLATMPHIVRLAKRLPDQANIMSLGCGPASYELWLATQTGYHITLVDHSPGMLGRAQSIASARGNCPLPHARERRNHESFSLRNCSASRRSYAANKRRTGTVLARAVEQRMEKRVRVTADWTGQ